MSRLISGYYNLLHRPYTLRYEPNEPPRPIHHALLSSRFRVAEEATLFFKDKA